MLPKNKVQFFPQPYPSAACDAFNCTRRSVYFIGRPDGPLNLCLKLCKSCAEDLVRSIPGELEHAVILPGGMVMVSLEEYDELQRHKSLQAQVEGLRQVEEQRQPTVPEANTDHYYLCPECNEPFASPQALAGHMRWKHPRDAKEAAK